MTETTMKCDYCGKESDLKDDEHCWDGWIGTYTSDGIKYKCPDCQKREVIQDAAERG